jgi:hypothetical protein
LRRPICTSAIFFAVHWAIEGAATLIRGWLSWANVGSLPAANSALGWVEHRLFGRL